MNLFEMCMDVSEGNPGAMIALGNLMLNARKIDPKAFGMSLMPVLDCQERDIKGEALWGLWKYICKEDPRNYFILLRSVQFGLIPIATLKEKIYSSNHTNHSPWLEAVRTIWLDRSPDLLNLEDEPAVVNNIDAFAKGIAAVMAEHVELQKESEARKLKELEEQTKDDFIEPKMSDSETPEVNPSIVGIYAFHQTNNNPPLNLEIRPNDNGNWVIGFNDKKARIRFTDDIDDCVDSTYNEMYKHISGSKEYSFSMNHSDVTHHWGVFHKQGQVQGWFYHTSDIEKKQGKFYIVYR